MSNQPFNPEGPVPLSRVAIKPKNALSLVNSHPRWD